MWLTRCSMTSIWPRSEAKCNEFHPVLCRKARSAPLLIRHFTACTLPYSAAIISGVQPQASSESISVMWLTSSSMTSTWPYREAICNEFHPVLCRKAGLAPFMIRHLTACTFPFSAASISGVLPVVVLGSISVMWLTSSWMTTTSPHSEAQCNEFLPLLSRRPRSALLLIRYFTACTLPFPAAILTGVQPCESRELIQIPRESKDSISATSSSLAAEKSRTTLSSMSWFT